MEILRWKVRITVLWILIAVTYSAHMALSIFEPNVIKLIIDGEMQISEIVFTFSVIFAWLIPLTMAWLSMTLKDLANRRANIVLGIVISIFNIGHLVFEQVLQPSIHMAQPSVHQFLLNLVIVVFSALIVWYAWMWPERKV